MHKTLVVAWREFRHTAMTKAFLIGAIIMPLLMMGLFIIVMPHMMEANTTPLTGTVAIIAPVDVIEEFQSRIESNENPNAQLIDQLPDVVTQDPLASAMLNQPIQNNTNIVLQPSTVENIETLKDDVRDGKLAALIVVPDTLLGKLAGDSNEQLEVLIPSSFSPNHTDLLSSAVSKSVVDVRLRRLGHEPSAMHAMVKRPRVAATRLANDGGEKADNEAARRIIPMAFMMLLWIATFTSGNYLLTTTIEEKGNKVMEVLLSAVSPLQLLGGKILGQAGVSLIMLLMYGGAAMAGLVTFALLDLIPVSHLLYLVAYFTMAYFMIASIMAAVGSAVTELRDAQSLIGPIMIILIIPLALWPVLSEHPNGLVATITSFTPPLIPFVMILRITASTEAIAAWQILLSMAIGFIAVLGMIWACARVFRIGVLMQGKPPSFLQLLRWIKQG
ncbi:MAG TPA: ABC transporter permease [Phycisphaerales bacterium]|jgi:ABC-2 type transport system permease protein|nr:ABC transporter permease [Phycisphaerales bacterium]|tara:strand:- start:1399 stop:2733 length:1335 start_codon:yes stop_codon:yes gene_type:complete